MLSLEEAQAKVLAPLVVLPSESVPLEDALGRVLAEPLFATRSLPPADNSAMDGYVVRWADVAELPEGGRWLEVTETIPAGGWSDRVVQPGTAAGIMTGAPLPPGDDLLVVMRENTDESHEDSVCIRGSGRGPGDNVRRAGEDVETGALCLAAGRPLQAVDLGLAASQGVASLLCVRRPVVGILSTGDEVQLPGTDLAPGHIYCGNSFTLAGLVREAGGIPRFLGIARDTAESLREHFGKLGGLDALVTIGGVSVGDYDHVKDVAAEFGAHQGFWKVAMRPGKPNAYGSLAGVPWWGLPGNPVSSAVSFLQYVRPGLRKLGGCSELFLPTVDAVLAHDIASRPRFLFLYRGVLTWDAAAAGWSVRTTGPQGSGIMSSLSRANCLISVPEDSVDVPAGTRLKVQLLPQVSPGQAEPSLRGTL
jgi:molybdopterin molybdotransferase